jgi:hypothetical protein
VRRRIAKGWLALGAVVVVCALVSGGVLWTQRGGTARTGGTESPSGIQASTTGAPSQAIQAARLATFGGKAAGLSFTYPAAWYAGGEDDADGPVGGSAGPAELLTFLSDQAFEPLCDTTKTSDGGRETDPDPPGARDALDHAARRLTSDLLARTMIRCSADARSASARSS